MKSAEELVENCSSLVSLPEVYLQVKKVIDDPESTMADLAHAISIDPGMTAMVLKARQQRLLCHAAKSRNHLPSSRNFRHAALT